METEPIRVAVLADTHGVLRPEVERILDTCDVIVHAGDFDSQMIYHKLEVGQPFYGVRGNNDRGPWSGGLGTVSRFEIGGIKFIMAHERTDIPSALGDVKVVIFGHSHMYYQQEINGRLWLNPGSCGYKRFTLPLSLAVMTIEDGAYQVETIWLEKGYGTPKAAKEQREKAKLSRYEKQQKRYQKKTGKAAGSSGDTEKQRELLFLAAKIQRLVKAGESREWVICNLGDEFRFAGVLYDICEKNPGLNAREIVDLLVDQVSF